MSYEEIEVLGQLSDLSEGFASDDELIELLSSALELTKGTIMKPCLF